VGVYGSVVTLKPGSNPQDGEIVHMAFVAYQAMREQLAKDMVSSTHSKSLMKKVSRGNGPTVMTALVKGDHVYLASSMKGSGLLYDATTKDVFVPGTGAPASYWQNLKSGVCPAEIQEGLKECGFLVKGTSSLVGHQNGGSCGEVMAGWAACNNPPSAHTGPTRVVAVKSVGGKMMIEDPCGADPDATPVCPTSLVFYAKGSLTALQEWIPKGCKTFNSKLGWVTIKSNTPEAKSDHLQIISVKQATYVVSKAKPQAP
jgi:hypothetical protein